MINERTPLLIDHSRESGAGRLDSTADYYKLDDQNTPVEEKNVPQPEPADTKPKLVKS